VKLVTGEQMRMLDQQAVAAGTPTSVLMENAGLAVAQDVWMALGTLEERRIVVLVGPGNNGGDGLVAARHLHEWGAQVEAYLLVPRTEEDSNYRQLVERRVPLRCVEEDAGFVALEESLGSAHAVVDALLGTGSPRPIEGAAAEMLDRVARARERPSPPLVIAVDLPTGVNCDTGAVDPHTVRADLTVTFGHSKVGLHALPGAEYAGRVSTVDIGLPAEASRELPYELLSARWVRERLPARPLGANKGTFGRVLVVAGSRNYVGAVRLAAAGALRAGAGLVTVACPESVQPLVAGGLTEATYLPLPEEDGAIAASAGNAVLRALGDYEVLLIGCGLGQSAGTRALVRAVLFALEEDGPKVLVDADGLNNVAKVPYWWRDLKARVVLTPHPGEMSRLTGLSIAEIQGDRLGAAVRFAGEWGQTVVLKGAHTLIAAPDGRAGVSPYANPALASAGTGDVLAGAIAGLLAQGLSPFEGACCGVYLHAAAAEGLREELGEAGLVAGDLLPELPRVIRGLRSG